MLIKRGKREECGMTPSKARQKMKRTLLYTYFTTLASLVLCCAMFLGTTMAWFSSDVTNTGNVIQVGTLEAELYHVVPAGGTTPAQEILLNGNEGYQVFDLSQKWAPTVAQGCTLKGVNKGDLNFKYDLSLLLTATSDAAAGTLTPSQQLELLSKFEVLVNVHDGAATVSGEETGWAGWTSLGTLDGFLEIVAPAAEAGEGAQTGEGEKATEVEITISAIRELLLYSGTLKPNVTIENGAATADSVHYIDVAIRMVDNNNLDVMGQSFTVSVKLAATQLAAGESVGE